MSVNAPQDSALLAAQVELFVLRASVPPPAPPKHGPVVLAPEPVPVTGERAAEILARMPKPVGCTARATEGGGLFVECIQVTGADESRMHALYVTLMEERLLSARGQRKAGAPRKRVVLLSGHQPEEELAVPEHAFVRWYQDYQPPPSAGVASLTEAQGAKATDLVFRVCRFEPAGPESLPPGVRSLLR